MLKKIDRYIIKKYLLSFFFTIVMISMVSVVMDIAERIQKLTSEDCTIQEIIFDYYLNFIPWINGRLWPLFALISVIFFTSRLAKNTEIVAILSSGVSFWRLSRPYLIASSFLALLYWYGINYVIPRASKVKTEFEATYLSKSERKTKSNNVHFYLNPKEKVYIRYYKKRDSTAHTFILERYDKYQRLEYLLKANKLKLHTYPNRWTLVNYEERHFNDLHEDFVIYKNESKDTTFNFSPDDFVTYAKQMEMMPTSDLRAFIQKERLRGLSTAKKFEVELHSRNADPFTIIILTFIGFALASRKVRGGMGFHLAFGVVLGSAFVIIQQFSETFSNNLSLSPALGAWIPNVVFASIAYWLIRKYHS